MTRKKMSWSEYVKWLQGKRVVDESGDMLTFDDGCKAELSTFVSRDGCGTCGYGKEFTTDVYVEEPCR